MLNENAYERIRRAYHVEKKSINRIAQEEGYSRQTITKIVNQTSPKPYQLTRPRPAPVFGSYQHRVEELLHQNDHMPPKQRYTGHKVFEILQEEGYQGSESRVRQYITAYKQATKKPQVFLPLEYDPGELAQVDWGEAVAVLSGRRQKIQFFLMRLCYSRRAFVMVFPSQAQKCFLYANACIGGSSECDQQLAAKTPQRNAHDRDGREEDCGREFDKQRCSTLTAPVSDARY